MLRCNKRTLLLWVLLMLLSPSLFGQARDSDPLPTDSAVVTGTLPNGMTYYLRHNDNSTDRASFYIIRNVGAIVETDNENGLAHFLEHMAFNGTEHFPGNSLITTLERHGVSFGGNLNAYTSTDETVYNISDVPTLDGGLTDTCLLILRDWSRYVSLRGDDIDAERGVITEEWRTRQTADVRVQKQYMPVLFAGSPYAVRDVIGNRNVIDTFAHETLRNFYNSWYRTDLQAIAVVGDIDTDILEKKIKTLFSAIPREQNLRPRPESLIPSHPGTKYVLAKDREVQHTSITIYTLFPKPSAAERRTHASIRESIVESMFNYMVGSRIDETMQRNAVPYMAAEIGFGGFVRNYDAYTLSVTSHDSERNALAAVLAIQESMLRYGFDEAEVARAKEVIGSSLDAMNADSSSTDNETYIEEMQSNFLTGDPIVEAEYYYSCAKGYLNEIDGNEILEHLKRWVSKDNRTIVVTTGPEETEHMTLDDILEAERTTAAAPDIAPYDFSSTDVQLLTTEIESGKTVKTKRMKEFDAVEWRLSNGATVWFRKAEYDKNRVAVTAVSRGGSSLYESDMIPSVAMAAIAPAIFGLGNADAIDLSRILENSTVESVTSINGTDESIACSASPKDVETMMQILYLQFAQPRFDSSRFELQMERERMAVRNAEWNQAKVMRDSLNFIMNNYSDRVWVMNDDYLNAISLDKVERIYRERFSNAADFTFIIVGNIDETEANALAERYIGSIGSSSGRREKCRDNGVRPPKGHTSKTIALDLGDDKTSVFVSCRMAGKYSPRNSILNSVVGEILKMRLTETLREREGGTYSVGVDTYNTVEPAGSYSIDISFECASKSAEYLKSLVFSELKQLSDAGPVAGETEKTVKLLLKNNKQSKYSNGYWSNILYGYYTTGVDLNNPRNFETILERLTADDVKTYVARLNKSADWIDIMFVPTRWE